tara:strand:- start:604 stop:780 length:177 start_codon:yes stop_codon:yes gene_type:complete
MDWQTEEIQKLINGVCVLYRSGQGGGIQGIPVVHQVHRFPDATHSGPVINPDSQDIIP